MPAEIQNGIMCAMEEKRMALHRGGGSGGGVGPVALAFLCLVAHAWARPAVPGELPPAAHADTETTTNVPFAAALDVAGRAPDSPIRRVCATGAPP